jgi:hypothetical protein
VIAIAKKETKKMTPENFCYWIQGLLELTPDLKTLTEEQVKMVRDHLGYVFTHMAPKAPSAAPPGNFDLRKALDSMAQEQTVSAGPLGQVSIC